mgnify:CR=1 FL=1
MCDVHKRAHKQTEVEYNLIWLSASATWFCGTSDLCVCAVVVVIGMLFVAFFYRLPFQPTNHPTPYTHTHTHEIATKFEQTPNLIAQ